MKNHAVKVAARCASVLVWIGLLGCSPLDAQTDSVHTVDTIRLVFEREFVEAWRARDATASTAVVDVVMAFAAGTDAAAREAFVMVMTRVSGRWLIASARAVRLF